MGTRVAPSLANIFMDDLEQHLLREYPKKCLLYKRFLDDIFAIWEHGEEELNKWLEYLNSSQPSIKFTTEVSRESVTFLDMTVHLDQDGTLWTDLYTKPSDSHNYLDYNSAHPLHCKRSLPYSQFLRIRRICGKDCDFYRHCCMIKYHLLRRGYPADCFNEAYIKATNVSTVEACQMAEKVEEEDPFFLITTYHPAGNALRDIVERNWEVLERSSATKQLAEKKRCLVTEDHRTSGTC